MKAATGTQTDRLLASVEQLAPGEQIAVGVTMRRDLGARGIGRMAASRHLAVAGLIP